MQADGNIMSQAGQETRQGIYVDLDSILDARLGTLARLGEDIATKTLESGSYHSREVDSFPFADMEAYKTLYAQRDSTTLSKTMCTGVISLVKRLAGVLTEQAIDRPYHTGPKIVVNLFPYSESLTVEEKDEMHQAITVWLEGTSAEVELLSCSHESLTPELVVANNIAAMFMYHHEDWMNAQARAFEKTRLGDVTLFGPAIFSVKPSDEQLAQTIKEAAHPFQALEMLASPLIHLQLIPASYFSILAIRNVTGTSAHTPA